MFHAQRSRSLYMVELAAAPVKYVAHRARDLDVRCRQLAEVGWPTPFLLVRARADAAFLDRASLPASLTRIQAHHPFPATGGDSLPGFDGDRPSAGPRDHSNCRGPASSRDARHLCGHDGLCPPLQVGREYPDNDHDPRTRPPEAREIPQSDTGPMEVGTTQDWNCCRSWPWLAPINSP